MCAIVHRPAAHLCESVIRRATAHDVFRAYTGDTFPNPAPLISLA
jgi:hypothetical protein